MSVSPVQWETNINNGSVGGCLNVPVHTQGVLGGTSDDVRHVMTEGRGLSKRADAVVTVTALLLKPGAVSWQVHKHAGGV